jgi:hemerythrin superfamily protein
MPDAAELLTTDHREVEQLFAQYKQTGDPEVVRRICSELTVHAAIEEKILYPALGGDVDGGKAMRQHAEQEHRAVKDAIFEIEKRGYTDPSVDGYLRKIIEEVLDHVEEEENEVFPKMREDLGEERLLELGDELARMRAELKPEADAYGPLIDLTKDKLYELAQEKDIPGRSEMTREELISALSEA